MDLEYRLLTEDELGHAQAALPNWKIENGLLVRTFEFRAYLDGVEFAGKVGHAAEQLDHHPTIEIGWRKVRVAMNTHAVNGISPFDLELAKRIDLLA